jgi:NAD(P)-dependent dehydrogenase (short-subunit alcohol dehydrogenase family)
MIEIIFVWLAGRARSAPQSFTWGEVPRQLRNSPMSPTKWDEIPYRAAVYPEIDPSQYSAGAFEDKVVLITGSGRGIGKELGLAFADLGAKVCFTDLELKDAQSAADEATQRTGAPTLAVGADVRVYSYLEHLYNETIQKLGPVDILVNNAGYGDFLTFDIARPEEYWDIITLNLKAPMDLTRLVLPSMIERNTGTIICNTTTGAVDNYPFCIPYTIAKTGQAKLMHCLHLELKDKNIRMFHVHPGTPATKMGDPSYAMKPYAQEALPKLKEWVFGYLPSLKEDIGLGVWTMVYLAAGKVHARKCSSRRPIR